MKKKKENRGNKRPLKYTKLIRISPHAYNWLKAKRQPKEPLGAVVDGAIFSAIALKFVE